MNIHLLVKNEPTKRSFQAITANIVYTETDVTREGLSNSSINYKYRNSKQIADSTYDKYRCKYYPNPSPFPKGLRNM